MARNSSLYFLIILSLLLYLADSMGRINLIKEGLSYIAVPVKKNIYFTNVFFHNFGNILGAYPQLSRLYEEKTKLQKESFVIQEKIRVLEEENQKLRLQMGAALPSSLHFIPALVVGLTKDMEISVGKREGVGLDDPLVEGNILIGRVAEVWDHRSRVRLLTDGKTEIAGRTGRGVMGKISGQFGDYVSLNDILQKDPLFLGDSVVTAGEGSMPPNLLIGKVSFIQAKDVDVYKQAKLEIPLDYKSLQTVFVVNSR